LLITDPGYFFFFQYFWVFWHFLSNSLFLSLD